MSRRLGVMIGFVSSGLGDRMPSLKLRMCVKYLVSTVHMYAPQTSWSGYSSSNKSLIFPFEIYLPVSLILLYKHCAWYCAMYDWKTAIVQSSVVSSYYLRYQPYNTRTAHTAATRNGGNRSSQSNPSRLCHLTESSDPVTSLFQRIRAHVAESHVDCRTSLHPSTLVANFYEQLRAIGRPNWAVAGLSRDRIFIREGVGVRVVRNTRHLFYRCLCRLQRGQ